MNSAMDAQSVTADEARSELSRILASPDFAASRQLTNFLQYIVSEYLAGRSANLKERTVAVALGRGPEFDPRLDSVVRVTAGKLRRSLERYYSRQGAPNAIYITVPKGCYCPTFGRHSQDAGTDGLSVARGNATAQPSVVRVAIAPFKSFTGGAKERFLAALLADDAVIRLGRMGRLDVIDCTAMQSASEPVEDLCRLAPQLRANFTLGGTVSKVGRHVRVTVRLINGDSGVLAWGDQYDLHIGSRSLGQQDEIADHIAASIGRLFGFASNSANSLHDE